MAKEKYEKQQAKNVEQKVEEEKIEETKEEVFTIEEFCSLKDLSKYYLDSFLMSFGNTEKKSISAWKNILIEGRLIKEEQIK